MNALQLLLAILFLYVYTYKWFTSSEARSSIVIDIGITFYNLLFSFLHMDNLNYNIDAAQQR